MLHSSNRCRFVVGEDESQNVGSRVVPKVCTSCGCRTAIGVIIMYGTMYLLTIVSTLLCGCGLLWVVYYGGCSAVNNII